MEFLYLSILGAITGIISALFGIGGGMIIVPAMLYIHYLMPNIDLSVHDAVCISVMQMIFSSVFGSGINYFKKKNLDIKLACFLGIGGLIGASFSGIMLDIISQKHLTLLFFIVSLITFYKFVFGTKSSPNAIHLTIGQQARILIIIGALTGIFAISLGIGGGVLLTPLLMYFLGFDTKKIVPLSLFFIMCASVSGTISFIRYEIISNHIIYIGTIIGGFSIIGVIIGSKLIDIMNVKLHHKILMVIYLISIIATFNKVLTYYEII